jgi:hypothetical protein
MGSIDQSEDEFGGLPSEIRSLEAGRQSFCDPVIALAAFDIDIERYSAHIEAALTCAAYAEIRRPCRARSLYHTECALHPAIRGIAITQAE